MLHTGRNVQFISDKAPIFDNSAKLFNFNAVIGTF